jgi:hypothetical protein
MTSSFIGNIGFQSFCKFDLFRGVQQKQQKNRLKTKNKLPSKQI